MLHASQYVDFFWGGTFLSKDELELSVSRIRNSSLHQQEQEQRSPRGFSINSVRFSVPAGVSTTVERRYVIVNLNNLTTAPSTDSKLKTVRVPNCKG